MGTVITSYFMHSYDRAVTCSSLIIRQRTRTNQARCSLQTHPQNGRPLGASIHTTMRLTRVQALYQSCGRSYLKSVGRRDAIFTSSELHADAAAGENRSIARDSFEHVIRR